MLGTVIMVWVETLFLSPWTFREGFWTPSGHAMQEAKKVKRHHLATRLWSFMPR